MSAVEQSEIEWWEAWWLSDYSWAGLASPEKYIADGRGDSGLQDYWRTDSISGHRRDDEALEALGEIVRGPDGTLWHIAHVPMNWRDGSLAKAGWSEEQRQRLANVIAARVLAAHSLAVRKKVMPHEVGANSDVRAQLDGSVLLDPPDFQLNNETSLNLSAVRCRLPDWDGPNRKFGQHTRFTQAYFAGYINLSSSIFDSHADFEHAIFSGYANFSKTKFLETINVNSGRFLSESNFCSTIFVGLSNFNRSHFQCRCDFNLADFESHVDFCQSVFKEVTSFSGSIFRAFVNFKDCVFHGSLSFYNGNFYGNVSFENSSFLGHTTFSKSVFCEDISVNSAIFRSEATFMSINVKRSAYFGDALFSQRTTFHQAVFEGEVYFLRAVFGGVASFSSVSFKKEVTFEEAKFEIEDKSSTLKSGRMRFFKAVFAAPVDFQNVMFASDPVHYSASFLGARFEDIVNFRGCGDHWVAALDEAVLNRRILLDETVEMDSQRRFDERVLPRASAGGINPETNESLLKELEGGCRTIKVAMGAARNDVLEQRYYRFELLARQRQSGIPYFERIASQTYGLVGNYGLSLIRPMTALSVVIATCTVLLLALRRAVTGELQGGADLLMALSLSLGRVFPFGAFSSVKDEWFQVFYSQGEGWKILAQTIVTLESLFAVALIFLFGLALRRRFQIG
jgi:predicted small integral membrane protein